MEQIYDFIVVGAGPSGCVVASRLADTPSRPSVLLLEAGGSNDSTVDLSGDERMKVAFEKDSLLNWGYKTTPQNQLNGQEIDYSKGKGLGGGTAINFCGWVVGPRDDYEEWARQVGDESFGWQNVKRCLEKIENLDPTIPHASTSKYVNARPEDHSNQGKLRLSYGDSDSWDATLEQIFIACEQTGLPLNPDVNTGNPLGMGMGSTCMTKEERMTSSMAYLSQTPPNLTVLLQSAVAKILFKEKTAIGVETTKGRKFHARKEVILSGGTINTPQTLMLSGVGPRKELEKHDIGITHDLPQVGKNLQDHCFSNIGIVMKQDSDSPEVVIDQSPTPMGWFKLPAVSSSREFAELPEPKKKHIQAPTVPMMEIASHIPGEFSGYETAPETYFFGAQCFLHNPQSRGTVTLQSSDPTAAPLCNPNFLSHPYDRRALIEGMRLTRKIYDAPIFASKTVERVGPKDDSDEAIWEHIRCDTSSSWHMTSTVRMGTDGSSACVDSSFRVFGLKSLRVVDLSVCPFVPNNHTQSTAYVLGEIAAEKMMEAHRLRQAASEEKAKL